MSEWYDIVIFTASLRQYADPVIDQLDSRNLASRRLFREVRAPLPVQLHIPSCDTCDQRVTDAPQSCLQVGGNFVKDFDKVGWDKSSTIIIDNSPIAYSNNRGTVLGRYFLL